MFSLWVGVDAVRLTQGELHAALVERHGVDVQAKLDRACVGVAGLGGLGSHIAVLLARLGVGRLVLADFDTVDVTNLHRQNYTMQDLGRAKADALHTQLMAINPYLDYRAYTIRVTHENAAALFADCDVVCEAFDRADQKAMLIEALLAGLPDTVVVSGSGMAGYGSANEIHTERRFARLYVCGDGTSDIADGIGLLAPRVALCAAQQATMALRLLLGRTEP